MEPSRRCVGTVVVRGIAWGSDESRSESANVTTSGVGCCLDWNLSPEENAIVSTWSGGAVVAGR